MSTIKEDLYKRFNGLLPIKRENPKTGQSRWYYMMPVKDFDEANPEYDIIDVPTQDTPNPMIDKHPEEYYIWRTCGDDKVRSLHQSRDGQIFSWRNPPQGGHPGEDYNCRCHAEPYVPKVNDSKENKTIDYSLYGKGFSKEFIDNMLGDTRFQHAMQRTKFNEGGFVNHPNDKGGMTNYGISSKYYPEEDIINITPQRAQAILYRDYWLKPNINQLPDEFADIVFDDGVVQGQPTAIMSLQKALGIKPDGLIGPHTLNAFQNKNYDTIKANFIRNVHSVEDEYLRKDPTQKVFEQGHRNRFNKY